MKTIIEELNITTDSIFVKTRVVGDIHSGTGMLPDEKLVVEKYKIVDNKIILDAISEEIVEFKF